VRITYFLQKILLNTYSFTLATARDRSVKLQPHISNSTVHSFTDHSLASNMKFKMATYVQWV